MYPPAFLFHVDPKFCVNVIREITSQRNCQMCLTRQRRMPQNRGMELRVVQRECWKEINPGAGCRAAVGVCCTQSSIGAAAAETEAQESRAALPGRAVRVELATPPPLVPPVRNCLHSKYLLSSVGVNPPPSSSNPRPSRNLSTRREVGSSAAACASHALYTMQSLYTVQ